MDSAPTRREDGLAEWEHVRVSHRGLWEGQGLPVTARRLQEFYTLVGFSDDPLARSGWSVLVPLFTWLLLTPGCSLITEEYWRESHLPTQAGSGGGTMWLPGEGGSPAPLSLHWHLASWPSSLLACLSESILWSLPFPRLCPTVYSTYLLGLLIYSCGSDYHLYLLTTPEIVIFSSRPE